MRDYEKLGAFYLGRTIDAATGRPSREPFLYDAKDLTTHAVCVGMTGSGKTGLAISLIEEAAIDGIPVIAVDPKGDLGNLMLAFPQLRDSDFLPWIDPAQAAREGHTREEHAHAVAETWRRGLADWDQDGERIGRFTNAAERVLFTPGSQSGRPLAILKSFAAPPPALRGDADAMRERVLASVSGLLALLKIDADPMRSREHILLSNLLAHEWGEGRDLDLASLIQKIQTPPLQRIGVMNLDTFYPANERFALAMMLNNLMASPGFAAWSEGEALDVGALLYARDGRPRLSILSIAHLSDAERMFLVTALLNELVAWMRAQAGSQTLRALFYMDEVFGYFPPTANPPAKTPMLTLLKQARAFGLGIVLSTQNPVDLDYKGLANAGTWFLGRLQTERDKARVVEGLEGASAAAGANFDRQAMEKTLAGLGKRVFLMNNVHEDRPTLFQTRWALSYLAGPLTREQIKALAAHEARDDGSGTAAAAPRVAAPTAAAIEKARGAAPETQRPVLPADIQQGFLPATRTPAAGETLLYRPALLAVATLHYSDRKRQIDEWRRLAFLERIDEDNAAMPWEDVDRVGEAPPEIAAEGVAGARFAALPAAATQAKSYARWAKMLASAAYRAHPLTLLASKELGLCSRPGESEGEFRGRLRDARRAARDVELEKLRQRYAPRLARLQQRLEAAQRRVGVEQDQYSQQRDNAFISIGATVIGALFGRKLASAGNVRRAATAMRGASRATREHGDIARAEEKVEDLREQLEALEHEFADATADLQRDITRGDAVLDEIAIAPRKADIAVEPIVLVWTPWLLSADGSVEPAFAA